MKTAPAGKTNPLAKIQNQKAVFLRMEHLERFPFQSRQQIMEKHWRLPHGIDADLLQIMPLHVDAIAAAKYAVITGGTQILIDTKFTPIGDWQTKFFQYAWRVQSGCIDEVVEFMPMSSFGNRNAVFYHGHD